jgi:integrase
MQSGLKIPPAKSGKLPPIIFGVLTVLFRQTRRVSTRRRRYDLLHMRHTSPNKGALAVQSKNRFANDQTESIGEWGRFHSMARRRYQHGSLNRVGSRWIARWREDVALPSGEVKRVHKKQVIGTIADLPTKKLAERALAKRLEPVNREDYRPTSTVTFGLFAAKWKKEIMIHHKPSSRSSEASIVNGHLVPYFGEEPLQNIKAEMIQRYVNTSHGSPKSIRNRISLLMVMWDMARAWEYVQHNPFPRGTNGRLLIKLPKAVRGKTYSFTVDETLAIIEKAAGKHNKWKLLFRTLAEGGMRPRELAGMSEEGLKGRIIEISQSVWQQDIQTPKTENAVRRFSISQRLADDLREYIAAVKADKTSPRNPHGLVWTTEDGNPLSMDNFRNRVLNPILDGLGIRAKVKALGVRGGNYPFRHMNATVMDGLSTPLKTRQKRLGHADIATTLTHYTHSQDADDMAVADALGALLSPKGTRPG